MGIRFLTVHSSRGTVTVVGPVTGVAYHITKFGTPVSEYDADSLLAMVADPCCGPALPFSGKVKLFGAMTGSRIQRANVPAEVLVARPLAPKPKPERLKKPARKRPVEVEVEDSVVSVVEEPEKLKDSPKSDRKD